MYFTRNHVLIQNNTNYEFLE